MTSDSPVARLMRCYNSRCRQQSDLSQLREVFAFTYGTATMSSNVCFWSSFALGVYSHIWTVATLVILPATSINGIAAKYTTDHVSSISVTLSRGKKPPDHEHCEIVAHNEIHLSIRNIDGQRKQSSDVGWSYLERVIPQPWMRHWSVLS